MKELLYRAYDSSGQLRGGTILAKNEQDALERISDLGLYPVTVTQGTQGLLKTWLGREIGRGAPSLKFRSLFLHMLSSLLEAGVPLDSALRAIEVSGTSKAITRMSSSALKLVTEGKSLSVALAETPSGFQPLEIGLIKSGEQNGLLMKSLSSLSRDMKKQMEMRSKLVSAMTYPLVLIVMAIASLIVIVSVLVPNLAPLFEQSAQTPPLIIRIFTGLREVFVSQGWLIMFSLLAFSGLVWVALRQEAVKSRIHAGWYKLPIARKREAARICRTLSLLLGNAMPVQHAIRFAADVCKSVRTHNEMKTACDKVVGGMRFHTAMRDVSVLRESELQLIGIGESTNKIDSMLAHVALTLDDEADQTLERLMTLLTPLATIALGGLIAGLIMSVMSAILSVNELVSG